MLIVVLLFFHLLAKVKGSHPAMTSSTLTFGCFLCECVKGLQCRFWRCWWAKGEITQHYSLILRSIVSTVVRRLVLESNTFEFNPQRFERSYGSVRLGRDGNVAPPPFPIAFSHSVPSETHLPPPPFFWNPFIPVCTCSPSLGWCDK